MLTTHHTILRRNVAAPSLLRTDFLARLSSTPPPASQFNPFPHHLTLRFASSKRWVDRQSKDRFARQARVQGLKSRAAFKLLQLNEKFRLFKPGQTVVDLGYAPGSWSQVCWLQNTNNPSIPALH
jgi:hypothetical protein